jgi:hypothetical protein
VKLHIEEAEHCETLGILCECGKKFKGNTSGGYYYHRLALHGHKPQPKIGLAASTATGDPHLPSSGLAANPASESHFAFEQVEEEVVQNCDHQYNLKGVARKFSSLFCFFNHIFSVADPGCLSLIRLFSIPDPESELYPSRIRIKEFKYFNPVLRIRIRDPGSGAFLTPGSGIRDPQ